jgi:hypothetical protein
VRALETNATAGAEGFPPFRGARDPWGPASLAQAIGQAVLGALMEAGLLRVRHKIHVGQRAGGYVRVFLEEANEDDNILFTQALNEAMGPLDRPRYVIPRFVDRKRDTWLSRLLPSIVGQYFQRRERSRVMLHAVPSSLARNRDRVDVYQKHWNLHVSPGEAAYAYRGAGKDILAQAHRSGQTPRGRMHSKDVFL